MSATVLGLKATSSIAWRSIGEALRDGILHFSGRSSDDLYEDQVLGPKGGSGERRLPLRISEHGKIDILA